MDNIRFDAGFADIQLALAGDRLLIPVILEGDIADLELSRTAVADIFAVGGEQIDSVDIVIAEEQVLKDQLEFILNDKNIVGIAGLRKLLQLVADGTVCGCTGRLLLERK
ncbi:hypothetical protein D3C75_1052250 [compost metagenome]